MAEPVSATDVLLSDGVILLGAALLFVLLFRRLGLGATLGYLVAGALVGPHGLGLVGDGDSKMAIAEIGIVLLLFLVGLELNPTRLWRLKRDIFGLGVAQVVICGAVLAALIYVSTSFSWGAAIALGLPLALSSTAQVLPGLKSSGRINSPFGEKAFSILLMQDLAIVPLITIIASLSRNPADAGPPGWQMALATVGAIIGLVLAGRFILRPLLRLIGRLGERELFVAMGLFTVLAAAGLMHALHLSTALGAFIAGVMLADSPYRHEIESDVEPFRSILLGLFFLAVGMVLDLDTIREAPLFILLMATLLVVTKILLIAGLARLFGMDGKQALALGLLLSQGGEFGFVLFSQAQDAFLIRPEAASMFSAIVTLSMVSTPFLLMIARRLEFALPKRDGAKPEGPDAAPNEQAIVIGYGRFGQTVGQMLMGAGFGITMIDKKPAQIEISERFDIKVYYGDGLRIDLLRRAGAEEARLLAFCIDDASVDAKMLEPILEAFPQAAVLIRAYDRRQLIALRGLDAQITREVYESAICMGRQALLALGLDDGRVGEIERQYREVDARRLDRQVESGTLEAAKELLFRPGRAMRADGTDTPIGDTA
jgi:CPA2 family monovalent cation:H+ antiporter-2